MKGGISRERMQAINGGVEQLVRRAAHTPDLTLRVEPTQPTLSELFSEEWLPAMVFHPACPHVPPPALMEPGQWHANMTSPGDVRCIDCGRVFNEWKANVDDPDHCDLCREPTQWFTPVVLACGPVLVQGALCSACKEMPNKDILRIVDARIERHREVAS